MRKKIVVGDCFEAMTPYRGKSMVQRLLPWVYAFDVGDKCYLQRNNDFSESVHDKDDESDTYRGENLSTYVPYYTLHNVMQPLPTLHLPIGNDQKRHGGKWFDMILSGEKSEEYRIKKGFYGQRLCENWDSWIFAENNDLKFKPFKVIHLTNGYGHHRPQLWAHIKEISIGKGKPEWGAPEHDVFIIRLGEVFHTKNIRK